MLLISPSVLTIAPRWCSQAASFWRNPEPLPTDSSSARWSSCAAAQPPIAAPPVTASSAHGAATQAPAVDPWTTSGSALPLASELRCLAPRIVWAEAPAGPWLLPPACPNSQPPPTTRLELALQQHAGTQDRRHKAHRLQRRRSREDAAPWSPPPNRSLHARVAGSH